MKHRTVLIAAFSLIATLSHADIIELRSGKRLTGKFAGGTAGSLAFETSDGMQFFETGQIVSLTFADASAATPSSSGAAQTSDAPAAAPAAPAAVGAAAPPVASTTGGTVSIPAGTPLLVRMVDPVSSTDQQGTRFAATLETDLVVNGTVAVRAGAKVYGRIQSARQAGRVSGRSELDLRLTELAVGSDLVPISTTGYTEEGPRARRDVARRAATGAAIGGIVGGGRTAGTGAAIGAAASGLSRGEAISVSSGTLLEFHLRQPVVVNLATP